MPPKENRECDVFLSFKNLDESGQPTRDSKLAEEIFNFLTSRGLHVFFSQVSLEEHGISSYKQMIDDSLELAHTLIAIGTARSHLESRWVHYEWNSFYTDMLSEKKPDGRVFVYVEGLPINDLPRSLRQAQCIQHGPNALNTLYRFITNAHPSSKPHAHSAGDSHVIGLPPPAKAISMSALQAGAQHLSAILSDGKVIHFLASDAPLRGATKDVYFSVDRTEALKFFRTPDPNRRERLRLLVERYNPTIPSLAGGIGGSVRSAEYFRKQFCWPTGVIVEPAEGVVAPMFPPQFRFASGPFRDVEKVGKWFLSKRLSQMLPEDERGEFINRVRAGRSLARCVRKLHQAGLAHSDLSASNILLDLSSGTVLICDVESLVVPDLLPAEVLGTADYVAPEVMETLNFSLSDEEKQLPNVHTDEHALAVLLYQLFFRRHPLKGPKVNSVVSTEEDELLSMGREALFIEHPVDTSNRPKELGIPYTSLGPELAQLFRRAFVEGLHNPGKRPSSWEWERTMVKTYADLYPCPNPDCSDKWLLLNPTTLTSEACPFCLRSMAGVFVPRLEIARVNRDTGQTTTYQLPLYHDVGIFDWHLQDIYPGEDADPTRRAYLKCAQGTWRLYPEGLQCWRNRGGAVERCVGRVELENNTKYNFEVGDTLTEVIARLERSSDESESQKSQA